MLRKDKRCSSRCKNSSRIKTSNSGVRKTLMTITSDSLPENLSNPVKWTITSWLNLNNPNNNSTNSPNKDSSNNSLVRRIRVMVSITQMLISRVLALIVSIKSILNLIKDDHSKDKATTINKVSTINRASIISREVKWEVVKEVNLEVDRVVKWEVIKDRIIKEIKVTPIQMEEILMVEKKYKSFCDHLFNWKFD